MREKKGTDCKRGKGLCREMITERGNGACKGSKGRAGEMGREHSSCIGVVSNEKQTVTARKAVRQRQYLAGRGKKQKKLQLGEKEQNAEVDQIGLVSEGGWSGSGPAGRIV